MDKQKFFDSVKLKIGSITIQGNKVVLHELTAGNRGELTEIASGDPAVAQAKLVIMGCDMFDADDLELLTGLPGQNLSDMADKIMELSGLADGDAKKS
jgi:hypothetical protein